MNIKCVQNFEQQVRKTQPMLAEEHVWAACDAQRQPTSASSITTESMEGDSRHMGTDRRKVLLHLNTD